MIRLAGQIPAVGKILERGTMVNPILRPRSVSGGVAPPPPPPPPTGPLPWAPPTSTNWNVIQVSQGGNTVLTLSTSQDYEIRMPAYALGKNTQSAYWPPLTILGGRNIKIIGGEINIPTTCAPGASTYSVRGIMLSGASGTVHLEGIWIHGLCAQALTFSNDSGNPSSVPYTVQVQNCRFDTLHPIWHTNEGDPVEVHTDTQQSWRGPTILRMYNYTAYSNGTLGFWLPRQYESNVPMGQWDWRNCNMVHQTADAYALWKDGPSSWSFRQTNCWLRTNPNHVASAYHSCWAGSGNCWTCWNPPGTGSYPVTGEAWNIGDPPGGDFVPVGVAGLNYVSPGYQ